MYDQAIKTVTSARVFKDRYENFIDGDRVAPVSGEAFERMHRGEIEGRVIIDFPFKIPPTQRPACVTRLKKTPLSERFAL